jgi:thymidylate synthase (FAD)
LYEDLLENGIAKECARRILPLCTPTTIFMQGTLRSWLHYIDLRAGVETQLEHRQIAEQCKAIFCEQFPVIGEAYWPSEAEAGK